MTREQTRRSGGVRIKTAKHGTLKSLKMRQKQRILTGSRSYAPSYLPKFGSVANHNARNKRQRSLAVTKRRMSTAMGKYHKASALYKKSVFKRGVNKLSTMFGNFGLNDSRKMHN
jgi:hypothetical protein